MEIEKLIEEFDYQTIKNEIQTEIKNEFNNDLTFIESDSFSLIVEAFIYREMKLRARINQAIRDAFAIINTDDTNNTAGSDSAYKRAIRQVSENIDDIKIYSSIAGEVEVIYHSNENLTAAILDHLYKDEVKPLTDVVHVNKAEILILDISINAIVYSGPDLELIENNIKKAYESLIFKISENLTNSKVISLAHVQGVHKIESDFVDTDIFPNQVIKVGNINISFEELVA